MIEHLIAKYLTVEYVWLAIGFLGQALFSARFILQWFYSEREKKSVIPEYFWYFSVLGGAVLLSYAIYKRDPVFIVGQSTGLLIYARNIYFVNQSKLKNNQLRSA